MNWESKKLSARCLHRNVSGIGPNSTVVAYDHTITHSAVSLSIGNSLSLFLNKKYIKKGHLRPLEKPSKWSTFEPTFATVKQNAIEWRSQRLPKLISRPQQPRENYDSTLGRNNRKTEAIGTLAKKTIYSLSISLSRLLELSVSLPEMTICGCWK